MSFMSRLVGNFSPRFSFRGSLPLWALLVALALCTACGGSDSSGTGGESADDVAGTEADDASIELEFWQSVKDSADADQLLAYIKKYPEGQFVELAESRLKGLSSGDPMDDPNVAGPGASNVDPPTAGSPSVPPPPPAQSRQDRVLSVVNRSLRGYRDARLHIYPHIPRDKADNAASVHGMDPRGILVLYDDGLRGGGKTGFVITERRVYWRFVKGADPLYLEFRDIQSAIARKNKFLLNGYDVSTTMSSDSRYAAEIYADLMLALKDAFR